MQPNLHVHANLHVRANLHPTLGSKKKQAVKHIANNNMRVIMKIVFWGLARPGPISKKKEAGKFTCACKFACACTFPSKARIEGNSGSQTHYEKKYKSNYKSRFFGLGAHRGKLGETAGSHICRCMQISVCMQVCIYQYARMFTYTSCTFRLCVSSYIPTCVRLSVQTFM